MAETNQTFAPAQGSATPSVASVALDPVRILRTYWPWLVGTAIVGGVVGIALFFVLNRTMVRYVSEAVFEAQPPLTTEVADQFGVGIEGEEGDRFMATQVFALRSEQTLDNVLEQPEVRRTRWAQDFIEGGVMDQVAAFEALSSVINAGVIPETAFFRVRARVASPDDAQTLADATASVYLSEYQRGVNRQVNELIRNVEQQIRALTGEIEELDLRIARLNSEAGISSSQSTQLAEALELQNLQPLIVENRNTRSQAQEQLNEYLALDAQEGPPVYPDAIREAAANTNLVLGLKQQIAAQRASYASLLERLGPSHASVQRALATLNALEAERDASMQTAMADQFSAAIDSLRNTIAAFDASHADMLANREELEASLVDKNNVLQQAEEAANERQLKLERLNQRQETRAQLQTLSNRSGRVALYSSPQIPERPVFPKLIPVVAFVTLLFVGGVAGIIVVKELREQRVRSPKDISLIPATRVLGVLPQLSLDPTSPEKVETATRDRPLGGIAESARELRNSIQKAQEARGHKTIVFASGLPRSGCTSVISNLAFAASNHDMRVLLIDANLRRPTMHTTLGVNNNAGLADILAGSTSPDAAIQNAGANLDVITAGANASHAYERLGTQQMTELLAWTKDRYDLVLLDTAPAVIASDYLSLAARCDASVLVTRAYAEKRGLVMRLRNAMGDARADFLGVVVNAVKGVAGGYLKENLRASAEYHAEGPQPTSDQAKPNQSRKDQPQPVTTEP